MANVNLLTIEMTNDEQLKTIGEGILDVWRKDVSKPIVENLGVLDTNFDNIKLEVEYRLQYNSWKLLEPKLGISVIDEDNGGIAYFSIKRKYNKKFTAPVVLKFISVIQQMQIDYTENEQTEEADRRRVADLLTLKREKYNIDNFISDDYQSPFSAIAGVLKYEEAQGLNLFNTYGELPIFPVDKDNINKEDIKNAMENFVWYENGIILTDYVNETVGYYLQSISNNEYGLKLYIRLGSNNADGLMPSDIKRFVLLHPEYAEFMNKKTSIYVPVTTDTSYDTLIGVWANSFKYKLDKENNVFVLDDEANWEANWDRGFLKFLISKIYSLSDLLADDFKISSIIASKVENSTDDAVLAKLQEVYPVDEINSDSIISKFQLIENIYDYLKKD